MIVEPILTPRIEPQRPRQFNGLAIIGESPGEDEIEAGLPFVGKSGKLLNTVLAEVGIVREDCLITNVFFNRPPSNKIDAFFRKPTPEDNDFVARFGLYRNRVVCDENRLDMERLDTELKQYQPPVILLLGATALWRVNQTNGITAARGTWVLAQPYGNSLVGIMATWHPSAVLRSPNEKFDQFVLDIKAVKDILDQLSAS